MKEEGLLALTIAAAGILGCLAPIRAQDEAATPHPGPALETEAEAVIRDWPQPAVTVARMIIDKYGQPASVAPNMLVWRDNGPWKRTIVHRDGARVSSAAGSREDVLQQVVSYRVPLDKFADLAAFSSRVVADRTREELSSISDSERKNFLALNLADEVISGWKDPETARRAYDRIVDLDRAGKSSPYLEGLRFQTQEGTGLETPDEHRP